MTNKSQTRAKLKFSMLIFASGLYFVSMKFIMLETAEKTAGKSRRANSLKLKLKKKNIVCVCVSAHEIKTVGQEVREWKNDDSKSFRPDTEFQCSCQP